MLAYMVNELKLQSNNTTNPSRNDTLIVWIIVRQFCINFDYY